MEPYKQKDWMYFHYVQKRMKLTQIQDLLLVSHGIAVTPQTLYNWCKRFDLLKYRGKGRSLKAGPVRPKSPVALEMARIRNVQRARQKKRSSR